MNMNLHSTLPNSTTKFSSSMSHINVKQTRVSFSSLPSLTKHVDTIASRSTGDIPLDAESLKVLIIQNDLLCNPCTAIQSLIEFNITYHVIYAFHDNALKSVHPLLYEAIIILGGRHGAYEEMIWLEKEKEFIRKALALDVPILGICLGCQLLAECIGGKVYAGTKGIEIGYKYWKYHDEEPEHYENEMEKKQTQYAYSFNGSTELKEEEEHDDDHKKDDDEESVDFNEEDFDDDDDEKDKESVSKSMSNVPFIPSDADEDEVKVTLDPFVYALACEDRDQFVILFHGDTFDVPSKCKISKQRVQVLASTNKYTSLFRVGKYSCFVVVVYMYAIYIMYKSDFNIS